MNIFKYNEKVQFPLKKLSVAMGNFDGLHLGHRSVIDLARPRETFGKFGVLTFDPHPREFFAPNLEPFRLMSKTAKEIGLEKLGLDVLLEVPFTEEVSLLEPNSFVKKILCDYFDLVHVVVGQDFKFGYQRKGTAHILKKLCNSCGIKVTIAPLVKNNLLEISSTAIREALKNGDPKRAADMLGDYYSIIGTVIQGDKRGRTLGYPTINLELSKLHLPKFGVYSAVVNILSGNQIGTYSAAVSIGERPTYGKQKPNLEAHLLNFSGDIYGEQVSISLVSFLRPELKFNSSAELINQMRVDCDIALRTIRESNFK